MNNIQCRLQQRVSWEGHPFTEILMTWEGPHLERKHALSRVWYVIGDSDHARASQVEAFKKRMASYQ